MGDVIDIFRRKKAEEAPTPGAESLAETEAKNLKLKEKLAKARRDINIQVLNSYRIKHPPRKD